MLKWRRKGKDTLIILIVVYFIYVIYRYYGNYMYTDDTYHLGILKWYNYSEDSLNGPGVADNDPKLIKKILNNFLLPPHDPPLPYKLTNARLRDPSMGQSSQIKNILKNKRNGFFIEVGALDGEVRSNTLFFERFYNWSGLLIEPDPLNFEQLIQKNRRAWLSPTCLSIKPYAEIVTFEQNENMGKIADLKTDNDNQGKPLKEKTTVQVQCFPLYSYLLALNVTNVDYFSLDVEGAELEVLKNIPFQSINIQTLSVEFAHVPGGKSAVSEFMFEQGYVIHSEVTHPDWLANDFIFMKA